MEAAGGYVKEIWLVSGWAVGWQSMKSRMLFLCNGQLLLG